MSFTIYNDFHKLTVKGELLPESMLRNLLKSTVRPSFLTFSSKSYWKGKSVPASDSHLQQLILTSIRELLVQRVLQHFGNEAHPVAVRRTELVRRVVVQKDSNAGLFLGSQLRALTGFCPLSWWWRRGTCLSRPACSWWSCPDVSWPLHELEPAQESRHRAVCWESRNHPRLC